MTRRGAQQMATSRSGRTADRQARRKRETREKLINGAQRVMAHKGIEATTIQEITDAADVGFGSFYNHFESKEAIVEAITRERIEPFGVAIDGIASAVEDPAEVLSAKVRHTLRKAMTDVVWGRFLFFSGMEVRSTYLGLLQRVTRDIKAGIKAGRFDIADLEFTVVAIGGAVIAVARGLFLEEIRADAPERAAAVILRLLGLSPHEAREIATRPLPDIALLAQPAAGQGTVPPAGARARRRARERS
jgi:AcrR family transcriptional regulator